MKDYLLSEVLSGVPKLASDPIVAMTLPPETIALALAEVFILGHSNHFVEAMGESALFPIIAEPQFGESLAKFSFVFKGISLSRKAFMVIFF